MKSVLKSGKIFYKKSDGILISPNIVGGAKVIRSDNIEDVWEEMKWIHKNFCYVNYDYYSDLKRNALVFDIEDTDIELYKKTLEIFNI